MGKYRIKKIEQILEGTEAIKKEQILAEIRLLKIQSMIAILTAITTVIAFVIINLPQIKTLFPQPKFKLEIEDNFLILNGKVIIQKNTPENNNILTFTVKEALDWVHIESGSYKLKLLYSNQEIYSVDFLLENSEAEIIRIPEQFMGNIHIFIQNNTPILLPEQMLEIAIDVTGNGYLWIYELTKQQRYSRIYPNPNESQYTNDINVEKSFKFPDKSGYGIFAGKQEGKEELLFIVTSLISENYADEIANRMTKIVIDKASVRKKEKNWGAKKITYEIKKP